MNKYEKLIDIVVLESGVITLLFIVQSSFEIIVEDASWKRDVRMEETFAEGINRNEPSFCWKM